MKVNGRWSVLAAVLLAALTGCGTIFVDKYTPTEQSVLSQGWFTTRAFSAQPVYCYRTIADPVCYAWPRKGEENRLVGYFGPPPY